MRFIIRLFALFSACSALIAYAQELPAPAVVAPVQEAAAPAPAAPPFANFHVVVPGEVYRGARPGKKGIDYLVDTFHIKTDIDLEYWRFWAIDGERDEMKKLDLASGFEMERMGEPRWIPANWPFAKVNDKTAQAVLDIMLDPSKYPLFIHCYAGDDRTGLMVGLYRVKTGQLSPAEAYQEMIDIGFHPSFHGFVKYFRDQTGYKGPAKLAKTAAAAVPAPVPATGS